MCALIVVEEELDKLLRQVNLGQWEPGNNDVKIHRDTLSVQQLLTAICYYCWPWIPTDKPNDSLSVTVEDGGNRESVVRAQNLFYWPMRKKILQLASHVWVYSANQTCIHTVPIQLQLVLFVVLPNVLLVRIISSDDTKIR